MPITSIDFSEFSSSEDGKGLGLQNLVASIGRGLGYRVQLGEAGTDRGRDVFFCAPVAKIGANNSYCNR